MLSKDTSQGKEEQKRRRDPETSKVKTPTKAQQRKSHMSEMGPVDSGATEHQNVHPRGARTAVDHAEQHKLGPDFYARPSQLEVHSRGVRTVVDHVEQRHKPR